MLLKSPRVNTPVSPSVPSEAGVHFLSAAMPGTILLFLWTAGTVAAITIANQKHLALTMAIPIAAAFLVELTFLAIVRRMVRSGPAVWVASAVAPYLVLTLPIGLFQWRTVVLLILLASGLCFWLRSIDPRWDWAFLAFLVTLLLTPGLLYPEVANLRVPTIGHLTWFRLGVTSVLAFRNHERLNFGFWPTRREWWIGARSLLFLVPVAVALNAIFPVAHFRIVPGYWWKIPAYFFAFLWTVGLSEEVLARGLLLEWIRKRAGLSAAVVISSLLFGATHLWFREFPNYGFAVLVSIAGASYALAYITGRGVRASTASHALLVTLWKVFFSG